MIFNANLIASDLAEPTRQLNGTNITYNYTSGRSYNVKFEQQGISYRYLTGTKPDKWWGPFPYKAFNVGDNVFLASWFEQGYDDYVTLLINFNNNILYGSAILSGKDVHFHGAKIIKSIRK
jgi:phenolic acid decarboxylase